jgi:hypothetical protein
MPPVFDPRVFASTSHHVEDAAPVPEPGTPPAEGDSKTAEARREEV